MSTPPEITQDHLDIARAAARALGATPMGRHAGVDELESQAYVVLWELALSWKEETNVPFTAYLFMNLRLRLIDALRKEYGRVVRGVVPLKMQMVMSTVPLESDIVDVGQPRTPGPEEYVLARDELRRLGDFLRTRTPHEQAAMLWPLYSTAEEVAQRLGLRKSKLANLRMATKVKAREHLEQGCNPNKRDGGNRTNGSAIRTLAS